MLRIIATCITVALISACTSVPTSRNASEQSIERGKEQLRQVQTAQERQRNIEQYSRMGR